MKFKYKKIPLSEKSELFGHSILRPIIPIQIIGKEDYFDYEVLIDSGADICIFDGSIGEALGINITSGIPTSFSGVQNLEPSEAYLHNIKISVGGHKLSIPAVFSFDISTRGYGILGQKGFFDIFTVKFDYPREEIELKAKIP